MENQGNNKCSKKEKCLKFFLIFIGTIIGAFLAFYFAVDMTFKIMLSPEYHMRRADKMIEQMDKQFSRDMRRMDKDIMVIGREMPNPVAISEEDDGYKVVINLKPFGNTAKNIDVNVENGNLLKINASKDVKKGDKENMMSMQQAFLLENNVDFNKMTKDEEKDKLVINLPYENKE